MGLHWRALAQPMSRGQNEQDLAARFRSGGSRENSRTIVALGSGVAPYSVLALGLLGAHLKPNLPANYYRNFSSPFQRENLHSNLDLAERLRAAGTALRAMPAQAAIA
jgi:aryl-alcohol dehydrogenase-like predicted oxidoreductase